MCRRTAAAAAAAMKRDGGPSEASETQTVQRNLIQLNFI